MMLDQEPRGAFPLPLPALPLICCWGGVPFPTGTRFSPGWRSSRSPTMTNETFAARWPPRQCCLRPALINQASRSWSGFPLLQAPCLLPLI